MSEAQQHGSNGAAEARLRTKADIRARVEREELDPAGRARQQRIRQIQQRVAAGTYRVSSHVLAETLLGLMKGQSCREQPL